jgi:hypothetical protein
MTKSAAISIIASQGHSASVAFVVVVSSASAGVPEGS